MDVIYWLIPSMIFVGRCTGNPFNDGG